MFINDLPPEILGKILQLLINYGPTITRRVQDPGHIIQRCDNCEPLAFARVCRYWRAVAFSTKNVWASFCGEEFKAEALAHWANLSEPLPLHLTLCPKQKICWRDEVDATKLNELRTKIDQFAVFSNRWDSLYFDIWHCELTESLADMLQNTASHSPLQRFDVRMFDRNTSPTIIDQLVSAIASFPLLRHFSWSYGLEDHFPRVFPWHTLHEVYVEARIEVEEFIWCLTQCTSARIVTFVALPKWEWGSNQRVTGAFKGIHSTLPRLETLKIDEVCDPYRFLQHFTLPSLVSLEIQTLDGSSPALQDFLARSQCPLRDITIQHVSRVTEDEIIQCLSTPYLRCVPRVAVSLMTDAWPYLAKSVSERVGVSNDLPEIATWRDQSALYIGWNKRRHSRAMSSTRNTADGQARSVPKSIEKQEEI